MSEVEQAAASGTPSQEPEKRGPGRPEYVPTSEDQKRVLHAVGNGFTQYEIAILLDISEPTLKKYYFAELERGHLLAVESVSRKLYEEAIAGKPTAMIFWLKARAGWSDYSLKPAAPDGKIKPEKPGKKAAADLAAANPDEKTDMGKLMAQRNRQAAN
jgi:hypothetical protein